MTELRNGNGKFAEDSAKAAKELEVCKLRRDGLTFRAIGARLGFSEVMAHRYYHGVQQRTREAANEAVEDVTQTELERLDRAIEKVTPLLDEPKRCIRAAEVLEKLSASRRKLLGLDKPAKQTIDVGGNLAEFLALGLAPSGNEPGKPVAE